MNNSLINTKLKLDRKYGVNLFERENSTLNSRPNRCGIHGSKRKRKKLSEYGKNLVEKQRLRFLYGMSEHQFKRCVSTAIYTKGDNGLNLVRLLESRLDAVVYKAKWARTIFAAKQLVRHGHITVNGSVVDIASYKVSPNDVVALNKVARTLEATSQNIENKSREIPEYLKVSENKHSVTVIKLPDDVLEANYPWVVNFPSLMAHYARSL